MKGLIGLIMFAACVGAALGVKCYVGSGTSTNLMDCGTSSDKCVKSVFGELVGKVCFSQMQMPTNIPGFSLPTNGCLGGDFGGTKYEYCVCSGGNVVTQIAQARMYPNKVQTSLRNASLTVMRTVLGPSPGDHPCVFHF